jgi:hypothetical protein
MTIIKFKAIIDLTFRILAFLYKFTAHVQLIFKMELIREFTTIKIMGSAVYEH